MKNINFNKPGISLARGAVSGIDSGLLSISVDELFEQRQPHSMLVVLEDLIGKVQPVNWNCMDVNILHESSEICGWFLSEEGEIWEYAGESIHSVDSVPADAIDPCISHAIRSNEHFIVGGGNHLYRKSHKGDWKATEIVDGNSVQKYQYVGFKKILDAGRGVIYVFGWHGLAYKFDGPGKTRVDLPVNTDLYDAINLSSGKVCVCGANGIVLLASENDNWKVMENSVTSESFWSIREFQNKIYLSTSTGLFTLQQDNVVELEYSETDQMPDSTYLLSACEECIWSIGSKNLVQYDGNNWRELVKLG